MCISWNSGNWSGITYYFFTQWWITLLSHKILTTSRINTQYVKRWIIVVFVVLLHNGCLIKVYSFVEQKILEFCWTCTNYCARRWGSASETDLALKIICLVYGKVDNKMTIYVHNWRENPYPLSCDPIHCKKKLTSRHSDIFNNLPCFFAMLQNNVLWLNLFAGVGYTVALIAFYVDFYYNVIIAWALRFLIASLTPKLPWSNCDPEWATSFCRVIDVRIKF